MVHSAITVKVVTHARTAREASKVWKVVAEAVREIARALERAGVEESVAGHEAEEEAADVGRVS
jgi:hypothetical protein